MKRIVGPKWVSSFGIFISTMSSIGLESAECTDIRDVKILVLIIASDNLPVYKGLEEVWRSYMHVDPAHEDMIPRIDEFDYLLRTNLSSFYVFPRLLEFVRSLPKTKCYAGCRGVQGVPFASGSGFLLSRDLVRILLSNKQYLYDNYRCFDDVAVGQLMHDLQINVIDAPREDILNGQQSQGQALRMDDGFHFRVKNDNPVLREATDVPIQRWLRDCFYQ